MDDVEGFQEIINDNSILVFKSEIQRTRVNYFPDKRVLLYHFWKKEKLDENGDLFLHIYPKEKESLPVNRRNHGFDNLIVEKNNIKTKDSLNFFLAKQLPIDVERIVTGQYLRTKRTWVADFDKVLPFSNTEDYPIDNQNRNYVEEDNILLKLFFDTICCVYNNTSKRESFFFNRTYDIGYWVDFKNRSGSNNPDETEVPLFKFANKEIAVDRYRSFTKGKEPFDVYKVQLPKPIDSIKVYLGRRRINIRVR
ncbi:hypothetical protein [uncultured Croceitalea sp.]|uniref:hypothetical protein n=1 Tax=uncultured Croceitalea sp. TaxID=1798908 RepID=UPI0033066F6E